MKEGEASREGAEPKASSAASSRGRTEGPHCWVCDTCSVSSSQ